MSVAPARPCGAHTTLPDPPRTTVYADNAYNLQHFIGSEYRKAAARGQRVTVGGVALTVGDTSNRPDDAGSARRVALHPMHPVRVGRTLPGAVALLADPDVRVVAVADQWQLYRGGRLLAAFDAGTAMAADAADTDNLSSEQIAAVLAPRLLAPANDFDRHWGDDLAAFVDGRGTGLAASDGAYLALIHGPLAGDGVLYLGGRLTIPTCPDCGQQACDDHRCPAATATPPPAPTVLGPPPAAVVAPATFAPQDLAAALRSALEGLTLVAPPPAATPPPLPPPQVTVAPQLDVRFDAGRVAAALAELLRPAIVATLRDTARADLPAAPPSVAPRSPRRPWSGATPTSVADRTAQEHILAPVRLPAPDSHLAAVPAAIGGDLDAPLGLAPAALDPHYVATDGVRDILRCLSSLLQAGRQLDGTARRGCQAFGLYGPAGGGKNILARQLAASLVTVTNADEETRGLPCVEVDLLPDSTLEELIGAVVLEPDGLGGTRTRARLGRVGLAAAHGAVVCVNEVTRSPRVTTALQSLVEDGEIILASPEAGIVRVPVHPAMIFVLTWNPGYEGDPDRPALAPRSRLVSFRLDRPGGADRARRARAFLRRAAGDAPGDAAFARGQAERRAAIGRGDWAIPPAFGPTDQEVTRAVTFVAAIEQLAAEDVGSRQIGLASQGSTAPGDRQLARYLLLGSLVGWPLAATIFAICCDQGGEFPDQWRLVGEAFARTYNLPIGPVEGARPPGGGRP